MKIGARTVRESPDDECLPKSDAAEDGGDGAFPGLVGAEAGASLWLPKARPM